MQTTAAAQRVGNCVDDDAPNAATDLMTARRSRDAAMCDALTGFRALREIH
jgi:hypothetical protein